MPSIRAWELFDSFIASGCSVLTSLNWKSSFAVRAVRQGVGCRLDEAVGGNGPAQYSRPTNRVWEGHHVRPAGGGQKLRDQRLERCTFSSQSHLLPHLLRFHCVSNLFVAPHLRFGLPPSIFLVHTQINPTARTGSLYTTNTLGRAPVI